MVDHEAEQDAVAVAMTWLLALAMGWVGGTVGALAVQARKRGPHVGLSSFVVYALRQKTLYRSSLLLGCEVAVAWALLLAVLLAMWGMGSRWGVRKSPSASSEIPVGSISLYMLVLALGSLPSGMFGKGINPVLLTSFLGIVVLGLFTFRMGNQNQISMAASLYIVPFIVLALWCLFCVGTLVRWKCCRGGNKDNDSLGRRFRDGAALLILLGAGWLYSIYYFSVALTREPLIFGSILGGGGDFGFALGQVGQTFYSFAFVLALWIRALLAGAWHAFQTRGREITTPTVAHYLYIGAPLVVSPDRKDTSLGWVLLLYPLLVFPLAPVLFLYVPLLSLLPLALRIVDPFGSMETLTAAAFTATFISSLVPGLALPDKILPLSLWTVWVLLLATLLSFIYLCERVAQRWPVEETSDPLLEGSAVPDREPDGKHIAWSKMRIAGETFLMLVLVGGVVTMTMI